MRRIPFTLRGYEINLAEADIVVELDGRAYLVVDDTMRNREIPNAVRYGDDLRVPLSGDEYDAILAAHVSYAERGLLHDPWEESPSSVRPTDKIPEFVFSTGRREYCSDRIIGIAPDLTTYSGYDSSLGYYGEPDDEGREEDRLAPDEQIELANYMLHLWGRYRARAEAAKEGS